MTTKPRGWFGPSSSVDDVIGEPLVSCPDCRGGHVAGEICAYCEGVGYISREASDDAQVRDLLDRLWLIMFGDEVSGD